MSLLSLLLLVLGGCAAARPVAEDRTGGLELELFVSTPDHRTMLYRLGTDGLLAFGGGADARDGETSWSARLDDETLAGLLPMIEPWLERRPTAESEPHELIHRVMVRSTGVRRQRFVVRGRCPELEAVHARLDALTAARLDRDLDRLARPRAIE